MRTYLAPIIGAILAAFITAILAYGLYQWYRRVRLRRNQPVPVAVPVEAAQPVDVALIVQGDMVREGGEFFQPVATAAAAETGGGQGEYFAPRAGPVRLPRIVQAPVPAAVYRYVESQTGWWGRRRWAAVQMGQWALEALGLVCMVFLNREKFMGVSIQFISRRTGAVQLGLWGETYKCVNNLS